jgi:hypothetical protein
MHNKSNPWQPSPVIFSLGPSILSSTSSARTILNEWGALAEAARRNVPILVMGPELQKDKAWNEAALAWVENIRRMATEK